MEKQNQQKATVGRRSKALRSQGVRDDTSRDQLGNPCAERVSPRGSGSSRAALALGPAGQRAATLASGLRSGPHCISGKEHQESCRRSPRSLEPREARQPLARGVQAPIPPGGDCTAWLPLRRAWPGALKAPAPSWIRGSWQKRCRLPGWQGRLSRFRRPALTGRGGRSCCCLDRRGRRLQGARACPTLPSLGKGGVWREHTALPLPGHLRLPPVSCQTSPNRTVPGALPAARRAPVPPCHGAEGAACLRLPLTLPAPLPGEGGSPHWAQGLVWLQHAPCPCLEEREGNV